MTYRSSRTTLTIASLPYTHGIRHALLAFSVLFALAQWLNHSAYYVYFFPVHSTLNEKSKSAVNPFSHIPLFPFITFQIVRPSSRIVSRPPSLSHSPSTSEKPKQCNIRSQAPRRVRHQIWRSESSFCNDNLFTSWLHISHLMSFGRISFGHHPPNVTPTFIFIFFSSSERNSEEFQLRFIRFVPLARIHPKYPRRTTSSALLARN